MDFPSRFVDGLLQFHLGTSMPCGFRAAPSGRGSPFHSLGSKVTFERVLSLEEVEELFRSNPAQAKAYLAERERVRLAEVAANREDERSLVRDLVTAGVRVDSIDDLVNAKDPYPAAIPVLIKHLGVPHRPDIVAALAMALICKEAGGVAWLTLERAFLRRHETAANSARWHLARALAYHARKEELAKLRSWASDLSIGECRGPFVERLGGKFRYSS